MNYAVQVAELLPGDAHRGPNLPLVGDVGLQVKPRAADGGQLVKQDIDVRLLPAPAANQHYLCTVGAG